jgi:hypothetical protein
VAGLLCSADSAPHKRRGPPVASACSPESVLYAPPPFQSLPIAPRRRLQPVLVPPTTTAADFNLTTRAASDRLMSLHGEIDWISEGIALACLCLFWSCDPSFCHAPPPGPLWRHLSCISHCPAWNPPRTSIRRSEAGRPALSTQPPSHFCLHCPVDLKLLGSRIILEILLARNRTFL